MAKIPLRTYIKEIETLIERGNTDEAIAHCRHVLKTFPKFLDAYRMLGKAYLESQRYNEASDVFKRALTAAPDDFVSHVGLSIINDEQKRLDDTIWHMERAFETQPSNAAVQSELQRLYGRRDGMEPHKIRLTRGALAHMYVQGELYPQAIGEIRSVINEDPGRTDMQVLLALAYFRNGQKVEATEACSQLLSRFPYCLVANRILVEILPGTGMADNVATYRSRVIELDPYAAHSPGSIFQSDEAPINAVTIERFDYKSQPAGPQPEWRDGLALTPGISAPAASQPDWLRDAAPADAAPAFRTDSQPDWLNDAVQPAAPADDAAIPDFLRSAGWGQSTGEFDEAAQSLDETPQADGIEKADLPEWVRAMAPTTGAVAAADDFLSQPSAPTQPSDENPDWLSSLGEPQAAAPAQPAGATPDWLSSLGEPEAAAPAQPASDTPDWLSSLGEPEAAAPAQPASDTPDWISSLGEPEVAAPAQPAGATPDWLSSLGEPVASASAQAEGEKPDWFASPIEEAGPPAVPNDASDLPDWLRGMGREEASPAPAAQSAADAADWLASLDKEEASEPQFSEPAPSWLGDTEPAKVEPMRDSSQEPASSETPASQPSGLGPSIGDLGSSAADQDAAMLWLESLAAKQGAKAEELITDPNARMEKPPEWVEQAKSVAEAPVASQPPAAPQAPVAKPVQEPPVAAPQPAPASGLGPSIGDLGASAADQDAAMLWLESLAAKQGAKSEELITDPNARLEKPPEWVEQAKIVGEQAARVEPEPPAPQPEPVAAEPVWSMPEDTGIFASAEDVSSTDQTSAWLRSLEAEEEKKIEEPAWSGEIEVTPPVTGPLAEPAAEADLPSWLRGLDQEQPPAPKTTTDELPSWLRDEDAKEEPFPEPTRPTDWIPETPKATPPPAPAPVEAPKPVAKPTPVPAPAPKVVKPAAPAPAKPAPVVSTPPPAPIPAPAPRPAPVAPAPRVEEPARPAPEPVASMPPAPMRAEEPVPTPKPPKPAPRKKAAELPPADRAKLKRTGMLPPLVDPALAGARDHMEHARIPDALHAYEALIRKGKFLEEVTFDLKEALYRFPVEVSIWQTLGDAYMRANRLQDALDAYTKAEELLR